MARRPNSNLVRRLLSGKDRLTPMEKEAIFEDVWQEIRPRPWRGLRPLLGLGAVVATGMALFFVIPTASGPNDRFATKGGGEAFLAVACVQGDKPAPCTPGRKLLFDVGPAAEGFFAAWAERPDGATIWYLPDREDQTSFPIDSNTRGVLSRAVVLGPEHIAGNYQVLGVFSDSPLSRQQLREVAAQNVQRPGIQIVRRQLEVR